MTVARGSYEPPTYAKRSLALCAGLGALTLAAGFAVTPARISPNALLIGFYLLGLSLSGVFFVALQYVTGSTWAIAIRRVPEAMAAVLPVAAVILGLVFVFDPTPYPWMFPATQPFNGFKGFWLTRPFFLARAAIYFTLWMALAWTIVRTSRGRDRDRDLARIGRNRAASAAFIVVFAVTFWLASLDWVMALEPAWYSTMFGLYNFSGLFSSGLAAITLLVVWLRQAGPLREVVSEEHLHDLGKLLFAFSTFWMYIWFCQYMLVWYAGIPEETAYFVIRVQRGWLPLLLLNLVLNWGVPFLALMSRGMKRRPGVLASVAVTMLLGRWLDLYLMIFPPVLGGAMPRAGWAEVGALAFGTGLSGIVWLHALSKAPAVPEGDPFLEESLHYHT